MLWPIINLVQMLASFVFLAMAFVAFFIMVTAGGEAKARESGIKTIIGAIIGYIMVKISYLLVTTIYGNIDCTTKDFKGNCVSLLTKPEISETVKLFTTMINWANGFIGIITVLLIIYTGWNILFN